MITGRNMELLDLENGYKLKKNSCFLIYGRSKIGKTSLINEFIKNKKCIYYCSPPASQAQQLELFNKNVNEQFRDNAVCEYRRSDSYRGVFEQLQALNSETKLIIIENFENIVKYSKTFIQELEQLVKGNLFSEPVMVVLASSCVYWVENSMVASIGTFSMAINTFIKLKELTFMDLVHMLPRYSVPQCMVLYAITGGVPGYIKEFKDDCSIKENICKYILNRNSSMLIEGERYVSEELRETSLYNSILYCIAMGDNKLNELHAHTGFGRDKISVYLKNLIEREIAEKVYSFDTKGNEHTRKGLYRIKAGFTEFWFRYIYPNSSWLNIISEEEFYDRFIQPTLDAFVAETFVKVAREYLDILKAMNKLPIKVSREGRWWGKNGDIDIVSCDEKNHFIIGKCNWLSQVFTFEMFEELMYNVNLAEIGKDYIYLFSRGSFDDELTEFAKDNDNVKLVSLRDL